MGCGCALHLVAAGCLAGIAAGFPTLLELHDRPSGRLGPRLLRWFAASRTPHRLLFITHALRRALDSEFGIRVADEQAVIAPDGVDLERYLHLPSAEELRSQLGPAVWSAGALHRASLPRAGHADVGVPGAKLCRSATLSGWAGVRRTWKRWRDRAASQGLANLRVSGFHRKPPDPGLSIRADVLLMPYERVITTSSGATRPIFARR